MSLAILIAAACGLTIACSSGPRLTGLFSDGTVAITSVPSNAAIFIDEGVSRPYDGSAFRQKVRYGHTPRTVSLTKGDHLIRLKKAGYKDYEEWIVIEAGALKEIHAVMEPLKPE